MVAAESVSIDADFCDECLADLTSLLANSHSQSERLKLSKEIDSWLDQRNLFTNSKHEHTTLS